MKASPLMKGLASRASAGVAPRLVAVSVHAPVRLRHVAASATLGLLLAPALLALDPDLRADHYVERRWNIEHGLPQGTVSSIAQTPDGYLWLGTHGGLVRTDGVQFKVFDPLVEPVLESAFVNDLAVADDGRLWIATNHGLYSYFEGVFERRDQRFGLESNRYFRVLPSSRGGVYASVYHGPLIYFEDEGEIQSWSISEGPRSRSVWGFYEDASGALWLCEAGQEVARLVEGRLERLPLDPKLQTRGILALDGGGDDIWLGMQGWLHQMRSVDGAVESAGSWPVEGVIQAVLVDRDGVVWAGTTHGLLRLVPSANEPILEWALVGLEIWALFEDRQGQVWIGTQGDGLHRLSNGAFAVVPLEHDREFHKALSAVEDGEGGLYAATFGDGLRHLLANGEVIRIGERDGLPSNWLWSVQRDASGRLWLGSLRGLIHWQPGGESRLLTRDDGVPSGIVFVLANARDGGLWVGSNGGLAHFDGERFERLEALDEGLSSQHVRAVLEDPDGTLWVGTSGGGLHRLRDGRVHRFTVDDGYSGDIVWSMSRDQRGRLWVGTSSGLANFRDGRWHRVEALGGDEVTQIIDDERGDLWLGTHRGIVRLRADQIESWRAGQVAALTPLRYGPADGVSAPELQGGVQPTAVRARDGDLWFPTRRGLARVDPSDLPERETPGPRPLLEIVRVDGAEVGVPRGGQRLELPADTRRVEISYTSLALHAPDRLRFRYRLEGFDKRWIDAGRSRLATFTGLPSGQYTFFVSVRRQDGDWGAETALTSFRIEPFFYKTPTFLGLCVLLAGLVLFVGHRLRVRGLVQSEQRLAEQVDHALAQVKVLRGMLPICASCKKVRDDGGYWNLLETYLSEHSEAELSHSLCPDCQDDFMREIEELPARGSSRSASAPP